MKLVYTGYYYSDEGGTTQLLTYTSQKLDASSTGEIEELLNGLVIQPAP